jgi:hypothetical protein
VRVWLFGALVLSIAPSLFAQDRTGFRSIDAAGYILNATAAKRATPGPPCPSDPHTVRRVVVITAGTAAGAVIGARMGRLLAKRW